MLAGLPTITFFLVDVIMLAESQFLLLPFGFVASAFAYAWALFRMSFLDIVAVVDELVAEYRPSHPDVNLSVAGPDQCIVETDPWLESAVDILLENALEHNDGPEPSIEVRITCATDYATIAIADDGPGIPDSELAVLEHGEETQLEHGSGIGLWIVHWIVDRSDASIAFDTGPDGTAVTIRVPR